MKRILITGVTGNLGRAAEKFFLRTGWKVYGVSRQTGLDLSDSISVDYYISEAFIHSFDIVLMAHGVQRKVMIPEITPDDINYIIGNNLTSSIILSQALTNHKKLTDGALIVYCSSIQATQPRKGRSLYAAAKGGLESFAKSMAVELAPHQRVVALRLGQMAGTMAGITFSPEDEAVIREKTPLPWVGFEDTARLILTLYEQPSLSGEVIEISSLHKMSIWPD